MPSLKDIEFEIATMLDIPDEELDEEQKLAMEAYLAELGEAEAAKVDAFAGFVKVQTARAKAVKEEAQRLAAKAKAIENKLAYMKQHYQFVMTQHDLKKISGSVYSISLRNSKSVLVEEHALDHLPDNLKKVTIEPRKAEIKKMLEAGTELIGCSLVENQSLNIR